MPEAEGSCNGGEAAVTTTPEDAAATSIVWYHRPGHDDGGREFGNAAAFAFEADLEVLAREATQNSLDERIRENGQPVRVRYTLHELTGEHLARFLDALRWPDLRRHYEAAAAQDQKVGRVIHTGLREMFEKDRLVLLRVDDYNANGLTGDDYEDGRFAAVVRRQLDSRKSDTGAGGSYGLGKATLWATSRLGLVLMNSTLSVPHEGRTDRRLIGRLDLPGARWTARDSPARPGSAARIPRSRTRTWSAPGGRTRKRPHSCISHGRAPIPVLRSSSSARTMWRPSLPRGGVTKATRPMTRTAWITCTSASFVHSVATSGPR